MKIGIIGAGNIGGNLTRRLTGLGHDVSVANSRGPETLAELASETGATPVAVQDAAKGAEILIVTIPQKAVPGLPKDVLAGLAENATVIDTNNYYPQQRDGYIAAIEQGQTESAWVAEQIGHPVVKAFNGIFAAHLLDRGRPAGAPDRIALPVSGDDPTDKAKVLALLDELGFDGVDVGNLAESWRQQPGTPIYGADADVESARKALAAATQERTAEWRAER